MTHTEDLIARLRDTASRGVSSWGDLQQEAADELETLINAVDAERVAWLETLINAVDAEREACAKLAEKVADVCYDNTGVSDAIIAAIRARGEA